MFSIPAALIVGIVGIIRDKRKILAIITTTIAGGFVDVVPVVVGGLLATPLVHSLCYL